jgi:hypothetical protein
MGDGLAMRKPGDRDSCCRRYETAVIKAGLLSR